MPGNLRLPHYIFQCYPLLLVHVEHAKDDSSEGLRIAAGCDRNRLVEIGLIEANI